VELNDVDFKKALEVIAQSAGVDIVESGKGVYIVRVPGEDTEGVSADERRERSRSAAFRERSWNP